MGDQADRKMTFYRHWSPDEPERITVDFWQQEVDWTIELIEKATALRLDGDILHVKVDNGWARYQVVERDEARGIISTRLIEGHLEDVCQSIATA